MKDTGRELNKDPKAIEQRQFELENMLAVANSNPEQMQIQDLLGLIYTYVSFRFEEGQGSQFLGFTQLYHRLTDGLEPGMPPDALAEKRSFFAQVRDHLRSRVDDIITGSRSKNSRLLFKVEGATAVFAQLSKEQFIEEFTPESEGELEFDLEREKRAIDIKLFSVIHDLGLRPARFKRCRRCGNVFYQPTPRKRNYCSKRCAGAVRSQRFAERKKEVRQTQGRK
jgi:hypothetical protein